MNHVFPGGSRVTNYQGQLAATGHKFGTHVLSTGCPCGATTIGSQVSHNHYAPNALVPNNY